MSQKYKEKYYIYRNLHKNCWSIKHKGKVIAHHENIVAYGCTFVVHEKGRQRVITEQQKNVHAYLVCDSFAESSYVSHIESCHSKVTYNPYTDLTFNFEKTKMPITKCDYAILQDLNVYV